MSEDRLIRAVCASLARAAKAEDEARNDLLSSALDEAAAAIATLELGTVIPVAGIFNALLRDHSFLGDLSAIRLIATAIPRCEQQHDGFKIQHLDLNQLRFASGTERWVADLVSKCPHLRSASFLMCQSLSATSFLVVLRAMESLPHLERITVARKLHEAVAATPGLPSHVVGALQSKTLGASTGMTKESSVALSEVLAQQVDGANSSVAGASSATAAPHLVAALPRQQAPVSTSDTVWAERVFHISKIPLHNLFHFKGRRMINRYVEALKSSGRDGRLQAEELEQARRFLVRDPSIAAKCEAAVRDHRKRTRSGQKERHTADSGSGSDGSASDEDIVSLTEAVDVAKKGGVSMHMAITDIITVQGILDGMRRRGEVERAERVERAVEYIRSESRVKVSYKELERSERRAEQAALQHDESKDEMRWALDQLRFHKFTEGDCFEHNGRMVQDAIDRLNRTLVTATSGEQLLRAFRIVRTARQAEHQSCEAFAGRGGDHGSHAVPSSLAEMDQWARQTLRTLFMVDNVENIIVARVEDIEEELEQLDSGDAERARCAMRTLQEIKYGRGISEDAVQLYRQLVSTSCGATGR